MQHHDHISIGELRAHLSAFIHCKMQPDGHTKYTKCIKRSFQTCMHASVYIARDTVWWRPRINPLLNNICIQITRSCKHIVIYIMDICLLFNFQNAYMPEILWTPYPVEHQTKKNNNVTTTTWYVAKHKYISNLIFLDFFFLYPRFSFGCTKCLWNILKYKRHCV